jgi:hypothetical protein
MPNKDGNAAYRANNREKLRQAERARYRSMTPEQLVVVRQNGKAWKEKNPKKVRESQLKHRYNLSSDDLGRMLDDQKGSCAVCTEKPPVDIDHVHGTKKVRGLLCHACNMALGLFKDRPDVMRAAANYVEKHQ